MPQDRLITLKVEPQGAKLNVKRGTRLLDALSKAGAPVRSECGGKGICGKCKIVIKDQSSFTEIDDWKGDLSRLELKSGYRLACECKIMSDGSVYVPEESRLMTRKFLVEGTERPVKVEPAIRKFFLHVPQPSLADVRSDTQRVLDSLKDTYGIEAADIDDQLLKELPKILRDASWKITATILDGKEVRALEKGNTSEEAYGAAVDIGTSKIIVYLSDLLTGQLLSTESAENPQMKHGEDVISRIAYAMESETHLKEMQRLIVNCLNTMITVACKKLRFNAKCIYELTVVGNTAMHHLFLGLQPKQLGVSPYVPVVSSSVDEKARNLSLKVNPGANVHVFPVVAGFVGGDAVADIVATGMHEADELSMVLDIGTNAEVILGDQHSLTACSCASGPAFEGAHIECGMKAVTGAIESLEIKPDDYQVTYKTIGNVRPSGLCGSGIIDATASLLKCRLMNREGEFNKSIQSPRLTKINEKKAFILVSKSEGAVRDIFITQNDIKEVQLAKAAIYSGCSILMKKRQVASRDIKRLYIAGAFGNYINPRNAKIIGLLPDVSANCIKFVGNAAGAGARMALISKSLRQTAALISRKTGYVELASESDFQTEFASAMFFPHRDMGRFKSIRSLFRDSEISQ